MTREFHYFVQKSSELRTGEDQAGSRCSVRQIDPLAAAATVGFADFAPSWQNSYESISRVPDHFVALGAFDEEKLLGCCILEPASGDIPLLAVRKGSRRNGIGSLLLREALRLNQSEIVKFVNTDIRCVSITGFLQSWNITVTGKQYEMIRNL